MGEHKDYSFKLKQGWWHIEDYVEPSDGRLVIHVQDFYIKKNDFRRSNFIQIVLALPFVDFKVINRISGKELSFIEEKYAQEEDNQNSFRLININLGSISNWAPVKCSTYLHIKIQYQYVDIWPIFNKRITRHLGTKIKTNDCKAFNNILPKSLKEKLHLLWPPGYEGQFLMSGLSQGKISITTPKGMNIQKKGKNTQILFYPGELNKVEPILMEYCHPHISYLNNKLKHHYELTEESYGAVLFGVREGIVDQELNFLVTYSVVNDGKFFFIPGFSVVIFVLIWCVHWDSSNLFYFPIIVLSLATLYLTLRKEKYQIPFNSFVFISIPLSIILFFIQLYFNP